ncbi:MAG: dTMP kinase [Acidobacteria bacterium]|nr:dTMP kinase [Acidobacteriota bacterium]
MLIAFEGIDSSGKSTHATLLYHRILALGGDALLVAPASEDYPRICGQIKSITHDYSNRNMDTATELFLYLANLAQRYRELIQPALATSRVVIADRLIDSLFILSVKGRDMPPRFVQRLITFCTDACRPDLTVICDVPDVRRSFAGRASSQAMSRKESEPVEFHIRLASGYRDLATSRRRRFLVLDTQTKPQEENAEIVWRSFLSLGEHT